MIFVTLYCFNSSGNLHQPNYNLAALYVYMHCMFTCIVCVCIPPHPALSSASHPHRWPGTGRSGIWVHALHFPDEVPRLSL